MGLSTATKNALLALLFENANFAGIGDATGLRGSSVAGNFYLSVHTANPDGGDQATFEATYTGYARVPVTRTAGAWSVAGGIEANDAAIAFGQRTGGATDPITHIGIGTALSGAGILLGSVSLASGPFAMTPVLATPRIEAGNLTFTLAG